VLELGTGSGCIAITLKLEHPELHLTATDVSAPALEVARRNATSLGADIAWLHGDWYSPVGNQRFDLIVSNPPYVAVGDPHLAALTREPALALTDQADGLRCLAEIIQGAPVRLCRPGWLVVEHGWDQASAVGRLAIAAGFGSVDTVRDTADHPRVTRARW
jgi:release factor glutamine methyltransferase